jgi:hypothetical protein
MTLAERILALGDIALLVENYFKNHGGQIMPDDSWNMAGFEEQHIETSFGWAFQNIPKPSLEQLEQIKEQLDV